MQTPSIACLYQMTHLISLALAGTHVMLFFFHCMQPHAQELTAGYYQLYTSEHCTSQSEVHASIFEYRPFFCNYPSFPLVLRFWPRNA